MHVRDACCKEVQNNKKIKQKQPKCLPLKSLVFLMYLYTLKYYKVIKRNESGIYVFAWKDVHW